MILGRVRQGHHALRRFVLDPRTQKGGRWAAHALAGFCLSAASLEQGFLPLVMGLVWACRGWAAVLVAAGGAAGYWVFWGGTGLQGLVWTLLALAGVLILADRRISRELPLLIPAVGMLTVSATGLAFQLFGDDTSILLYLIRVAMGGAAPWLFSKALGKENPVLEWSAWGLFTLGLAQIAPITWLGLGFVAAGAMTVAGAFPCAAVVGLALDLARITPVPMTAVTVLAYLVRFLPRQNKGVLCFVPGVVAAVVMRACGQWVPGILPGILLGGLLGTWVSGKEITTYRRGETGVAQVQLEMAAQVLAQTQKLLLEVPEPPVDEDALAAQAAERACMDCPYGKGCRDARRLARIPGSLLQNPLLHTDELPIRCRKPVRVLTELQRSQQRYRAIQADRQRQKEYREAVIQQYQFLSGFLQELSDRLLCRSRYTEPVYDPVVSVYANRQRQDNADYCMQFHGVGNTYYIVLCDGMGTGPGALQEGKTAGSLLRKMLSSGFPAEDALRSLNSLCALRDRAGAVTVDLVRLELDSGKVTLYKWGAAPSYLVSAGGAQKLGAAGAPPGISVSDYCQASCRLHLRREQLLLLVSDGLAQEQVLRCCKAQKLPTADTLARELLDSAREEGEDDATVVAIQLFPAKS